jgi:septum formation topological specificity factor MinE
MHAVEHFPNVKVSDNLADVIINMCKNIPPTKQTLESLKTSEREIFDLLLYVSGLNKKLSTKKENNVNELKERLKLVEAEIRAGNNNPVAKKELKGIVQKLQLYNCISMNNAKNYLKQFN